MAEAAVRSVRTAILNGTFAPSSQLRETRIAAELGISRAPLREALHRLDEEGLVVRVPFKGAYVATASARAVAEIESLRAVLEPYAVECATLRLATSDGREDLAAAVRRLHHHAAQDDRAGSIDSHLSVHRAIYRASGNEVLTAVWHSWETQLRLFLAIDHRSFEHLNDVADAHQRLLEAIESGDMDVVREEFAGHIHPGLPHEAIAVEPERSEPASKFNGVEIGPGAETNVTAPIRTAR